MFGIVIKLFILYIKAIVVSVCGDKQGIGRATDTHPLHLLAACNNRMGGLLTVQTSNLHQNKNIYNNKN